MASISAWIVINGRPDRECSVLDASPAGVKLVTKDGSGMLERFELAFFPRSLEAAQMRGNLAPRQGPRRQIRLLSGTVLAPKIGNYFGRFG